MSGYKESIEKEIEVVKKQMDLLYQEIKKPNSTTEFYKLYSEIHSKQVDIEAKKQRLENIGKSLIIPHPIPKNVTF